MGVLFSWASCRCNKFFIKRCCISVLMHKKKLIELLTSCTISLYCFYHFIAVTDCCSVPCLSWFQSARISHQQENSTSKPFKNTYTIYIYMFKQIFVAILRYYHIQWWYLHQSYGDLLATTVGGCWRTAMCSPIKAIPLHLPTGGPSSKPLSGPLLGSSRCQASTTVWMWKRVT